MVFGFLLLVNVLIVSLSTAHPVLVRNVFIYDVLGESYSTFNEVSMLSQAPWKHKHSKDRQRTRQLICRPPFPCISFLIGMVIALSQEHFRGVFSSVNPFAATPCVGTEPHLAQQLRPHSDPCSQSREHSPGAAQLTDVVLPAGVGRNVPSPDEHFMAFRVEVEVFGQYCMEIHSNTLTAAHRTAGKEGK